MRSFGAELASLSRPVDSVMHMLETWMGRSLAVERFITVPMPGRSRLFRVLELRPTTRSVGSRAPVDAIFWGSAPGPETIPISRSSEGREFHCFVRYAAAWGRQ